MTTAISITQKDIIIRATNLYNNGYIIDFPEDGESLLLRDKIRFIADSSDSYYPLGLNERLDLIAYNVYKEFTERAAELWWVIADANNLFNPLDLSDYVGQSLLIPNFQKIKLLVK